MHSRIQKGIPTHPTRGHPSEGLRVYRNGAFTRHGVPFQALTLHPRGLRGPIHHISLHFSRRDSVCPLPSPFATP
jgi:hypothetical protein